MYRSLMIVIAAAVMASACNKPDTAPDSNVAAPTASTAQSDLSAREKAAQAQVQQTTQSAMDAIPPELREKFQVVFNCEIERNLKLADPKPIDAGTIHALTARLKANPSMADDCAN